METVRDNLEQGLALEQAVTRAVETCITRGILADILKAQKGEVVQMVLEGFDQEKYEKAMKQEGYEDGYQDGQKAEQERGICQLITTLRELSHTREETARKVQEKYQLTADEAEGYMRQYWGSSNGIQGR